MTARPFPCLLRAALLALGLAPAALAQGVTLSGTVRDAESGEALPYANVVVEGTSLGTATNTDGRFALVGVPADSVVLIATYLGFQPARVPVDARTQTGPLRIELAPATAGLAEVVVTAEQYQIMQAGGAVSQVTVSPRDLAVLPSVGEVDIFRSLQLLPGVSGTNEGTSGLFVRGGTPDQNLVLLDGMTVYHVDHFFGFFSAFNADAIKDVQLYKSGFPAPYGGRTSSVVDLVGRTGSANDAGLGVGVNLLSASAVAEAPLGRRASVLVSARRSYTDVLQTGLYDRIFDTITGDDAAPAAGGPGGALGGARRGGALGGAFSGQQATVQPDFYFYDLNAKLSLRPTDRDVFALSLYNGQDNLDESRFQASTIAQQRPGAPAGAGVTIRNDVYDVTGWGNVGVSGKWSRQWAPRLYTNALVAYSEYFSESERDALFERLDAATDTVAVARRTGTFEDNRLGDLTLRLDAEWQAAQAHKLTFGAQATRSDVRYELTRNDTLAILDRMQEAVQASAYVQDTWTPGARLQLTAGARLASYDLTGQAYAEPRAAVRFELTDRVALKGAYGRYHQFVARVVNEDVTEGARDFWLLADGGDVGVQAATHYVLGASYMAAGWLVDAEAYRKDLSGLSEFSLRFRRGEADFAASDLFYGGTGVATGAELLVQRTAGRHTGWLSYTLARVEHTFPALNEGEPFPALHDQRHELKLVGSSRLGQRWTASATWAFATGKPYTAPESEYTITLLDGTERTYIHVGEKNGERLPAYHRLDAAVHYRFPVGPAAVDLGLSVFNLYDRTNVWYKEFDLTQAPMVTTDVTFLGFTPNLSLRIDL